MDCYRPVTTDSGTAASPKAMEYQKLRVGAYELEEDQKILYTEESDSKELWDITSVESKDSSEETSKDSDESGEPSETIANWWLD